MLFAYYFAWVAYTGAGIIFLIDWIGYYNE
jgi:hypothetical protein